MLSDGHIASFPDSSILDELICQIQLACEDIREAGLTALDRALDAGDDLNEAQTRVSINWKRWLRENCSFIAVSTALLYQRLARHRPIIEAAMSSNPDFTLRDARRLLTAPRSDNRPPPEPVLVAAMKRATNAERTEALTALGLIPFLRAMPADWRPQLEARLRWRDEKLDDTDITYSEVLRRALSLIKIAKTSPGITPAVASSNENEALVALRQLFVLITRAGLDLNEIAIVRSSAKREKKRAA